MSARNLTTIQIPAPLHRQLKALANTRDTTMTGMLADLVRRAIEAGEIPDRTPGFDIEVIHSDVIVYAGNERPVSTVHPAEAEDLAAALIEAATGNGSLVGVLTGGGLVEMKRVGTRVEIKAHGLR